MASGMDDQQVMQSQEQNGESKESKYEGSNNISEGDQWNTKRKHKNRPGIQRAYGGDDNPNDRRGNQKGRGDNDTDWRDKGQGNNAKWRDIKGQKKNQRQANEKEHGRGKQNENFEFFYQSQSVFSQWYPADFVVDELKYNCMEQYMMHQKASKCFHVLLGSKKINCVFLLTLLTLVFSLDPNFYESRFCSVCL